MPDTKIYTEKETISIVQNCTNILDWAMRYSKDKSKENQKALGTIYHLARESMPFEILTEFKLRLQTFGGLDKKTLNLLEELGK